MSIASPESRIGARVRVQRVGSFLSNMVMPNIGAFIAWGLLTALFIEKGWITSLTGHLLGKGSWVAHIGGWGDYAHGGIVAPTITYLLPILIGYTGGKLVYDTRGAVVGAIATMGVIAGADVPMFLGAMIMGPFGGWVIKRLDALWDGKIRPGFEMLVNNFSAGIAGGILATGGFFGVGPLVSAFSRVASNVVNFLVDHGLLPLTSIFIEPAKVLFLNNAVNHGVLTPLGTTQAAQNGKSILFLLEANPGPGLGLLLAFWMFGKGMAKSSAPGAALIHFIGGIHEVYFPYVLMKPKLILATIAGGMTGVFINVVFHSGLRAPAAPGSIIAVFAQTATGSYLGVTLSVSCAAAVTFLVAALLLKTDRATGEADLGRATVAMEAMKGKRSIASTALLGASGGSGGAGDSTISTIVFACDAGMGSSAMGASVLRKKIRDAGRGDVTVVNRAIANLDDTYDVVVTHQDLADRARARTPSALHISVEDFMNSPRYDEIVTLLTHANGDGPAEEPEPVAAEPEPSVDVLPLRSIVLDGSAGTSADAITEAGELLLAAGAVDRSYLPSMHERERLTTTYMGNGLAIPHGTNEAKAGIRRAGLSLVRYAEPIDWNGKPVEFVIGIAGYGDEHRALLNRIAQVFIDKEQVERLHTARTAAEIKSVLDSRA
ncbi:PTS mannitol transporter subunit IICBA [Nocardia sp. CDC160]|uniref:PTS mannitol transporter subunit IICBA n=1 Tax=Nocardia sp. CDC160 TaxID=3112166 RepID=UPI002DB86A5C|nr:PTS mannitol transporter subunit IICBA [Nocardia sp. CDC160]MEC3916813.1 PTS mannitol transporter subunit IICBA [Nocardia sp. CDC160]